MCRSLFLQIWREEMRDRCGVFACTNLHVLLVGADSKKNGHVGRLCSFRSIIGIPLCFLQERVCLCEGFVAWMEKVNDVFFFCSDATNPFSPFFAVCCMEGVRPEPVSPPPLSLTWASSTHFHTLDLFRFPCRERQKIKAHHSLFRHLWAFFFVCVVLSQPFYDSC